MGASDSYLVVERMIRTSEVMLSELERLLVALEAQELITEAEHEALLDLARKISPRSHPAS